MGQTPNTRRDGWTAERQLRFLDTLSRTRSVTRAASSAGLSRESAYRLRSRSALFAVLWERALKGHKVERTSSCPLMKNRSNPPKVTKWKKWKDPWFRPLGEQLCDFLLAEQQRPKRHAEADHADRPDDRSHHRHARGVKRQVHDPRAQPDPAAERGN